jgi:PKD repeat protein
MDEKSIILDKIKVMNKMKKLLSTITVLVLLFSFSGVHAQATIFFNGTVTDLNGAIVANHYVYVQDSTTGQIDSAMTNSGGFYSMSVTFQNSQGMALVYTYDCNQVQHMATYFYGPQGVFSHYFSICNGGCSASYTYSTAPGTNAIQFTGTGYGAHPFTFSWDFGDGHTSNLQNPVHTYGQASAYGVYLTVTDSTGCSATYYDTVYTGGCSAFFTSHPDSANTNSMIFNGSASGTINPVYSWTFGDGSFGIGQNPTHTYNAPGTYAVCLTIIDSLTNCSDTYCDSIVVGTGSNVCIADFTYNHVNNLTYLFLDRSIPNSATYFWDFGDSTTSTHKSPSHTFPANGTYNVCLTITKTDFFGNVLCTDTHCDTVVVNSTGNCNVAWGFYPDSNAANSYSFWHQGNPNSIVTWDFGDGHTSNVSFPNHTYSSSGTYLVCFTIDSCPTVCDTLVVGAGNNCSAQFTYSGGQNTTAQFFNQSVNATTYLWDFGDSTSSTLHSPSHTYAKNGTYLVCLTIIQTDFLGNIICTDTYCDLVQVGTAAGCHAGFGVTTQGLTASFNDQSTGTGPFNYSWSFGDGTGSSQQNPAHTYAQSGTYNVCLSIWDSTCADTTCMTITVSNNNFCNIYGNVTLFNGVPADYATVYLIDYDSAQGTLTGIDTLQITPADSGTFTFTNVAFSSFFVKAALDSVSAHYVSYMPTYYNHELFWNHATYVGCNPIGMQYLINMIPGNNPGGPGFIGGLVSQGANKTNGPGDPVGGVDVLLLDNNDNSIAHTITDVNGKFNFPYLAWGTYKVYVEIPAKYSNPNIVTIGPNDPSVTDLIFKVNKKDITTGIFDLNLTALSGVEFYPNPVENQAIITFNLDKNTDMTLQVIDMTGKLLIETPYSLNAGDQNLQIDMSQLIDGMYMLNLNTDDGRSYQKKFIKL